MLQEAALVAGAGVAAGAGAVPAAAGEEVGAGAGEEPGKAVVLPRIDRGLVLQNPLGSYLASERTEGGKEGAGL